MAVMSRLCAVCGAPFTATRTDAEICSGACRKRRSRAVTKAREEKAAADLARLLHLVSAALDESPSTKGMN
ncbi:hypothetical protein [Nocardioides sp. Soil796]|uniref:hypothetical protein n=1 Tax=Nocardioides sp. Soil796 TaxID=1736412 RepID=UPI00070E8653|nr:hypothetical protein [Nocardioides sp. Soil796]KRF16119.1 hypothetical protein ASH02_05855 [Nocardioides sp. Soil796]